VVLEFLMDTRQEEGRNVRGTPQNTKAIRISFVPEPWHFSLFVSYLPFQGRPIAQDVFFLILDCEAIGTAATPGLLCQPRVMVKMIVQKQMECRLAVETEVVGENLPQRHFCPSQNPT
jgi:hypothetical protein